MTTLKSRALSATLWSAVEQVGAKGLSTIFMIVFARFLTPEDFGLFAAATLAIGFASKLAVFGLNTVVVQRTDLDASALSTAFWMALGASVVLASGLSVFAPLVAVVFGNASIATLIPVLAVGMVAGSAAALVTALLRRDLNMKAIARRTLLANAMSGAIATPFILSGFGAWGLVIQSVGGAILTLVLTVLLVGWPVKFTFDLRVAREMLRFGAPVTGADLLTYYNRESPKLFVGLFLGVEALGVFAMAMRVMNLMLEVVGVTLTKVTLPVMSQVNRATPERMAEIYLRLVRLASTMILPSFALVIVLREPLVAVLLGETWLRITPIVGLLCAAGMLTVLNYLNGSTLVAIGRPQGRFLFSTLRAVVGSLLLAIATPLGVVATGAAFLARGVIVEPMQLLYLLRHIASRPGAYFAQLRGPAIASVGLVVVAYVATVMLPDWPALAVLVLATIAALASYAAMLYFLDKAFIAELRGLATSRRRVA